MKRPHDDRSRELARRLAGALDRPRGLPAEDVESVGELIRVGEFAIALETLCTQLFEYDVDVDAGLRQDLEQLGRELGVDVARLLGDPWANMPRERAAHRPDRDDGRGRTS